jgi:hypothetical protein
LAISEIFRIFADEKRNCNEEEYYCYDDGVADGGM